MSIETNFLAVISSLQTMSLSHFWNGYGSAIFLEFGQLTEKIEKDGTLGNPQGEITVGIEWSWRVEDKTSIICGSWSDDELWPPTFDRLIGEKLRQLSLYGRLPEIELTFDNGLRLLSFATSDGSQSG